MGKKKKRKGTPLLISDKIKNEIPNIAIVFVLENLINKNDQKTYYITTNLREENIEKNIYFYKGLFVRELLLSMRKTRTDMAIKHNGKRYLVTKRYYLSESGMPEFILPKHIVIKEDAGFHYADLPWFCRVIEVLLYSPYTESYELARVTYNEKADMCYMDLLQYAKFVKQYGHLSISYSYSYTEKWETKPYWEAYWDTVFEEDDWCDDSKTSFIQGFRSKSIMRQYGYNVSKNNGLTRKERQGLLGEIMDLEIMSREAIIQHIFMTKKVHSGIRYEDAQKKWDEDIKFVEGYQIDTNRFAQKKDVT